jgi:hypothetical protein
MLNIILCTESIKKLSAKGEDVLRFSLIFQTLFQVLPELAPISWLPRFHWAGPSTSLDECDQLLGYLTIIILFSMLKRS